LKHLAGNETQGERKEEEDREFDGQFVVTSRAFTVQVIFLE
jgi:hypothetical protein